MSGDTLALVRRGMRKGPMRELALAAIEQGCRYKVSSHNGLVVYPPTGPPVTLALTASDHRAWKNVRGQLRRGGVEV
jgi:hypothetical protein